MEIISSQTSYVSFPRQCHNNGIHGGLCYVHRKRRERNADRTKLRWEKRATPARREI
jgi:hypothetical protein